MGTICQGDSGEREDGIMDLLNDLRVEVERAEAHRSAQGNSENAAAYNVGRRIEALRGDVDKVQDASAKIEAENALSLLRVVLGAKTAPVFDRETGDALVSACENLSKIPGMIDQDAKAALYSRWIEATGSLSNKGKGKGGSTGTRGNRPKAGFAVHFQDAQGNVKTNKPAQIETGVQVNEARYAFGFKADAKDVTAALEQIIKGEVAEVRVAGGKMWREALAG